MAIASFSFAVRAPHPAATGGGFGLAPWENPGPRPPKAGATLSPTGQGKFRRDDQPSLRYGSAGPPSFHFVAPRQGGLVQKWVVEMFVHFIRQVAALTRRCAPPSPIRWARDIAQVKRPDDFICSRFRFFIQNVIFHSHVSHRGWLGDATPMTRQRQGRKTEMLKGES
jgi:hypothetical protein